ncbi:MAG: pseudouridine synthase, partial [Bradyrhizobium sp.]|nr:pseudouridine synthase [Bradyrhizobium sp.]
QGGKRHHEEHPRRFGKDHFGSDRLRDEGQRQRFGRRQGQPGGAQPWRRGDDGPREERGRNERPRLARRQDRHTNEARPKFGGPRSPRQRQPEQERKTFAKRPAFGGRGAYRQRTGDLDGRARREENKPKKTGERIAKVLARAGLSSRRDAEEWIVQRRVSVNGRIINSPALDVTSNDVIAVDGNPLPLRQRTRLFLYHKPRGLLTTHADPEGRATVFANLPEGLPRLISVGRLDFNTEGLLLLTNDGGLARVLELPETAWLRRYRVRAHGEVRQARLDELKNGIEVGGIKYGPIYAALERDQGSNVWLVFAIREGKNREVRNVLSHLGLEVNRLIRISYGPFQLGELAEGEVEEVNTPVLREQLGEKVIKKAGADFTTPAPAAGLEEAPGGKKPFKPSGRSALIADRKGRRVLVQHTGKEEARAHIAADPNGRGRPRRPPRRGYHGKRDLKPL